jgi:hypothetical protein
MNAQEQSRAGKQGQGIRQATIILPYFEEEVPGITLRFGEQGSLAAFIETQ